MKHAKKPNYRLTQWWMESNAWYPRPVTAMILPESAVKEGFGIKVGLGDEAIDGSLEIDNASKDTVLRFDPLATVAMENRRRI